MSAETVSDVFVPRTNQGPTNTAFEEILSTRLLSHPFLPPFLPLPSTMLWHSPHQVSLRRIHDSISKTNNAGQSSPAPCTIANDTSSGFINGQCCFTTLQLFPSDSCNMFSVLSLQKRNNDQQEWKNESAYGISRGQALTFPACVTKPNCPIKVN